MKSLYYEDRFGNALTILPNCEDDGFSFTLTQASEKCAEMIEGGVRAGKDRFVEDDLVLVFKRNTKQVEIVEEGSYTHGASCGLFSGIYKRVNR